MVRHIESQHGGVLQGRARFRVCGRCGSLKECKCSPSQEPLPDAQLLSQFLYKLVKKKVKLGPNDR